MCGQFSLKNSPLLAKLEEVLGFPHDDFLFTDMALPGSVISIIRDADSGRRVNPATWWLLLEQGKPNYKYASFNSRSDKLNQKRSLGFQPFRKSRCIIPATGFVEGVGDRKTYHYIELENSAICFGGIYREYINPDTGESILSASIITLPPILEWQNIHPKSFPLMLPLDKSLIDKWLDPTFHDVNEFEPLLVSRIRQPQIVTPIAGARNLEPVAESFSIP